MAVLWIEPVFDRVLSDCVYGNIKGCISADMLNRIENNTLLIKEIFLEYNIQLVSDFETNTAWTRLMYYRVAELNRMKQNIMNLRVSGIISPETPVLVPSAAEDSQVYGTYNDMEKILFDIARAFTRMQADYLYCGEFYCGGTKDDQHLDDLSGAESGTFYTASGELFTTASGRTFIVR